MKRNLLLLAVLTGSLILSGCSKQDSSLKGSVSEETGLQPDGFGLYRMPGVDAVMNMPDFPTFTRGFTRIFQNGNEGYLYTVTTLLDDKGIDSDQVKEKVVDNYISALNSHFFVESLDTSQETDRTVADNLMTEFKGTAVSNFEDVDIENYEVDGVYGLIDDTPFMVAVTFTEDFSGDKEQVFDDLDLIISSIRMGKE